MKIILMDIDGVLSPLGRVNGKFATVNLDGWSTVAIPADNSELLKTISKLVKVVWSSSWEFISNNICNTFGIDSFEYIEIGNNNYSDWNKLPAIIKFIENNQHEQILLIDDEVDSVSQSILSKFNNLTIINTNPITGLSLKDRYDILQWINDWNMSFLFGFVYERIWLYDYYSLSWFT